MEQHALRSPRGATHPRKRVGRGDGSGRGTYSGRGIKGQQSRSGHGPSPAFEGGQTPLVRRLPRRRGFRNPFRVAYTPVNLRDLARFDAGSEVTPESLRERGIVRSLRQPIKVLGTGELEIALTVRVPRISSAARAKIEAAGGAAEELSPRPPKREAKQTPPANEARAAEEEETPPAESSDGEE